ncbi:MAG: cytochrome P450 [Kutzneria sp.]|nr:cytochrome P450 [Kutzneria sp.]
MTDAVTAPSFPMARTCPMRPPPEYAPLRAQRPIAPVTMPNGQRAWLVTKYEYARALLADRRITADRLHPAFPKRIDVDHEALEENHLIGQSMVSMDPPEHTARRRMVISEFSVRRVRTMRPRIQQIVDGRIDAMLAAGGPLDLVRMLSLPVSSLVMCELLGVPAEDRPRFQRLTAVLVAAAGTQEQLETAGNELNAYLDGLVTAQQSAPSEGLLSRLITRNRRTGAMDHTDLVNMASLLLLAGYETTANMISLGATALLAHPDQLARIRENPKSLPQGIEELLRYFSIVDTATSRVALEDIEVGGMTIRAGEGLIVATSAANWDADVFAEPERLDLSRPGRRHVAFGFGVHQCLGQNLARVELEIVFGTLFRRIPGLRLTVPATELPYKETDLIYGIHEVPVTW